MVRHYPIPLTSSSSPDKHEIPSPLKIISPVLEQVYPHLLQWRETYGHPNIPLGSPEGRMCQTLRRLHIQQKLTDDELHLLEELEFRFHSLEECYYEFDFDEMLERLIQYEREHQNQYQVPKKYAPDPELGAWVTGLRRIRANMLTTNNGSNSTTITSTTIDNSSRKSQVLDVQHQQRLDDIGFSWTSSRKCGSQFMTQYRNLYADLMAASSDDERRKIWEQPTIQNWVAAQREAHRRGTLSPTRIQYLQQLPNTIW
jgi:hypothetical protein